MCDCASSAMKTNWMNDGPSQVTWFASGSAAVASSTAKASIEPARRRAAGGNCARAISTCAQRVLFSRRGRPAGAGPAAWLEAEADLIVNADGDEGRGMVGRDDDSQAVGEFRVLDWNMQFLQLLPPRNFLNARFICFDATA